MARLFILLILSLTGAALSFSLTHHFYEVRYGASSFKSSCNLSQTFNCDVIAASPYAELIPGYPLSSFSTGWFIGLFFISLFAFSLKWKKEALFFSLGMGILGVLTGLPYFYLMAFRLKTYCLQCLGVDATNLGILAVTATFSPFIKSFFKTPLPAKNESQDELAAGVSSSRISGRGFILFSCILAFSVAGAVFGLKTLDPMSAVADQDPPELIELTRSIINSPVVPVKTSDVFPSIGPKNALITIVEFSDFQCPWCRMGALTVQSMINRYPGKIRVEFRNFPWDQTCNPRVQSTGHPVACEAARYALCVHKQGQFEEIYDRLFETQEDFKAGFPAQLVKKLKSYKKMDEKLLNECVHSSETAALITNDIQEATLLGVRSTPTFFINGHMMEGSLPVPAWVKIIDHFLDSNPSTISPPTAPAKP